MGLLLAVLAGTDLLAANWGYNRTANTQQVYPVTPGIAYLQAHAGTDRVLALNHGWSIEGNRPPPAILPPNTATVYGLNDVAGYDSLLTRRAFRFMGALDGGRNPAPQENGNLVFTSDYASPEAQEADARYVVSQTPLTDPALKPSCRTARCFFTRTPGRCRASVGVMAGRQAWSMTKRRRE